MQHRKPDRSDLTLNQIALLRESSRVGGVNGYRQKTSRFLRFKVKREGAIVTVRLFCLAAQYKLARDAWIRSGFVGPWPDVPKDRFKRITKARRKRLENTRWTGSGKVLLRADGTRVPLPLTRGF